MYQLGPAHTCGKHTLQLADNTPTACSPAPPGHICCQLNHLALGDSAPPYHQRALKPRTSSWQGSTLHRQITRCVVIFELIKYVFLPCFPLPTLKQVAYVLPQGPQMKFGAGQGAEAATRHFSSSALFPKTLCF